MEMFLCCWSINCVCVCTVRYHHQLRPVCPIRWHRGGRQLLRFCDPTWAHARVLHRKRVSSKVLPNTENYWKVFRVDLDPEMWNWKMWHLLDCQPVGAFMDEELYFNSCVSLIIWWFLISNFWIISSPSLSYLSSVTLSSGGRPVAGASAPERVGRAFSIVLCAAGRCCPQAWTRLSTIHCVCPTTSTNQPVGRCAWARAAGPSGRCQSGQR